VLASSGNFFWRSSDVIDKTSANAVFALWEARCWVISHDFESFLVRHCFHVRPHRLLLRRVIVHFFPFDFLC
jgi:hypothetical protein